MLKKNKSIVLAIALFFIFFNLPVIAKADAQKSYSVETVNNITVKVNISDSNNFSGQIYFFIKDSKGMKRVFVLDKDNNYSKTYELPIGKAKILGITIYDEDKSSISLPYTYEGSLNTTTSQAAVFTINLDNGNSVTDNSTEEQENTEEENTNDSNGPYQQEIPKEEQVKEQESIQNSSTLGTKTIINIVIDVILFVVIGGMYLYIKYKKKRKNSDDNE